MVKITEEPAMERKLRTVRGKGDLFGQFFKLTFSLDKNKFTNKCELQKKNSQVPKSI